MNKDSAIASNQVPYKKATLIFLLKKDSVLLAMKKRGFGEGKWNGAGGKVAPKESIEKAAIREIQEEIGVSVSKDQLQKVAVLDFLFEDPRQSKWDQQVHVFITTKWRGEPKESEEMRPKWYTLDAIPYESMWSDDQEWLPLVLAGKKIEGKFTFNTDQEIIYSEIKETRSR